MRIWKTVLPRTKTPLSEVVASLEALAAKLGVPVRYDTFDRVITKGRTPGGLCRLRGQPIIVLDANLTSRDHAATLAAALSSFDLDAYYLPPPVRATLRRYGHGRVLTPRPLARAKPLKPRE